ncbi:2-amino-4-hydroxy-6-hydroxymethyldihydropteridine diphosphokinase [Sporosarcina sp. HYO08]|uniref:2-amino-4-hydroxy-6- hydroxymethyldihydropteridine diphosphokinase n=1 Tax=Sporosarcina sp. HYO08 TaxID=1759557 RepID=UPI000791CA77|nr:2-amino-4-hydroxy-6-hydroxymethyldihydropteridine diphosphokinase [Sporosarcina sp. HYO08]KXH86804.1 2-amino-4-hydroxy-6-hydroxymethyldihydropteridine pyrophosphokinase [Sporosarcina sp. HYO08]
MNVAFLSIGSNIGDRLDHLTEAVRALHQNEKTTVTVISSIYETAPVGYTDQADFLNLVVKIETELDPFALLELCQQIEQELGRERIIRWGPRTVDLDILLYNNDNIEAENLTIPHPRMYERAFVLVPLIDVASDFIHPKTGRQLLDEVADQADGSVRLWKTIEGVQAFLRKEK